MLSWSNLQNIKYPIDDVALVGITIDFKFEHSLNIAKLLSDETLSGIMTFVKLEQFLNIPLPMVFMLSGIATDVKLEQLKNTEWPRDVTGYPSKLLVIDKSPE